jgi:integrase
VHEALHPVFVASPNVGQRLRERIEAVLDYAASAGLREGANPAVWKGHLEHAFASFRVETKHHAAMPYDEVPACMAELRALPSLAARALEFTILTAARTGEARFARWSEIDAAAGVWTIPGERMKRGREHRVPLSGRALAILAELPREAGGDAVFPGRSAGGFLNQDAMADVLTKLRPGVTVHGFRSSFREWADHLTSYPRDVCEAALAHSVGNAVERAYLRNELLERRARLMADWASYCDTPARGTVVAFRPTPQPGERAVV